MAMAMANRRWVVLFAALLWLSDVVCCAGAAHTFLHRKLMALVPQPPLVLTYHKGPLLAGSGALTVHLMWYGSFNSSEKFAVTDFFKSFVPDSDQTSLPFVSSWWKTTASYKDSLGAQILSSVELGTQTSDEACSIGKTLKRSDLASLALKVSQSSGISDQNKFLYLILTAKDVYVDGFCVDACASHSEASTGSTDAGDQKLVYAWVGDSASRCPGKCAWPFADPKSFGGPDTPPLIPPNGDVGVDGMIINIAAVLAGAATNPFKSGYFQGDVDAPLEAATACVGIFGKGAFPGYAGELLVDSSTKASFNVHGINGRTFLLPALWNPTTLSCSSP